jgi:ferredoxin
METVVNTGDLTSVKIASDPMQVVVLQDICVSAGNCVMAAAEIFDQREDDGVAFVIRQPISATDDGAVRTAIQLCPATAILLQSAAE